MNSEVVNFVRGVLTKMLRGLLPLLALSLAMSLSSNARAKAPLCRVSSVKLIPAPGGGSEVYVRTDRSPSYSARIAQKGRRLIVDMRDAVSSGAEPAITDPVGVVGGIMTQEYLAQGTRTTRVLIQLLQPAAYRISSSQEGLRIVLLAAEETAPMKTNTKLVAKRSKTIASKPAAQTSVADIRYDHGKATDRVMIKLTAMPAYTHSLRSATRSVLELSATQLPTVLKRKLDTKAFGGLIHAVSSYRSGDKVLIDVDHAEGVSGAVVRQGSALHYVFTKGKPHSMFSGVASDGREARKTKTIGQSPAKPLVPFAAPSSEAEWSSEPDRAGAFLLTSTPLQPRVRYAGRRIDLDLKEADIHNVFRMIADVGRINIVAADNVDGTVTVRMKNVPWDQALEVILRAKKLGMERRGNIIRIALQADLAKEREIKIAELQSRLALEPVEVRLIPVSYADASEMQQRAKEMLSPRGSISVDTRTNVLIAQDVAGNLNRIEELVRALDTQTPQVLIEARIVEATSSFKRDVGIQWGGDVQFGAGTGNETGLFFPSKVGLVGGGADAETPTGGLSPTQVLIPNPNFAVNLPATVGTGAGGALGLTLGSIDNTVNLAIRLSAAEATGMLRIVSSPRILTLDNHEARINQGTLIPFSQVSAQGVQTVFQEAKLQLLVVPHVTADGSVSMHVRINRDEPDFNQTSARGDPTILKREAETDLLVRDGHTAVIGGIYTRNTGRNVNQVPVLGDIPVLGVLFQRRTSSDVRGELVIFITPRIVNRSESLGR